MIQEQTTLEKPELQIPTTLKSLIEALIFAAQEPLSISQIKSVYIGDATKNKEKQIETETIKQIIYDLNREYEKSDRPYRIIQIAGGYQFATTMMYAEWLGRLYKEQSRRKLSQSGVETLAIIAYKQPITKADVEKIRGVNCDYVIKTLLEKELLTVVGRAESVGRPLLYGTTKEFLKHFGLNDITDLPRPREIEEILGESQFETERRMLEAQEGAEKSKKEQEDFKSRLPHIPKKKPELDEKGVEIIQNTKNRQIKLVHLSEKEALEEAGQEKLQFNQTDTTEETNTKSQSENVEISNVEEVENIANTYTETNEASSVTIDATSNQNADVNTTTVEPVDIQNIDTEQHIKVNPENTEAIKEENTQGIKSEAPQQKNRWTIWKEKIQGFIKKLLD